MIKFYKIDDINHEDFQEAIRIYTESFPLNERQSVDVIKKKVKENYYQMFIGVLKDRVVFMALLYPLEKTDFIVFAYMATDKRFRNNYIGTKFIQKMENLLCEKSPSKYLILEVENPKYGSNKNERERRVRFYKRLGAKEMKNVRYILPPLSGRNPTEMILMVMPGLDEVHIDGDIVKKLILQMYKELYNRNENDDLLNSFIHKINNSIELIGSID